MAFDLNKNEESKPSSKFDLSKSDAASANPDEKPSKSKARLLVLLGAIVLGGGAWYFLSNSSSKSNNENVVASTASNDSSTTSTQSKNQNDAVIAPPVDTTVVNSPENTSASNNKTTPNSNTVSNPDNNNNAGSAVTTSSSSLNNRAPATFGKGSNSISNIDKSLVKDIVSFMEKNPNSSITVNGYASSEGELIVNQKISQSRADAFKRYLISKGIVASRIVSTGKGIDNPIGSNDTEEGRKKNRRVEITLQ